MHVPVVPILTLLITAVIVAVASRRLRIPFNIALVGTGILLGRMDWTAMFGADFQTFRMDPEIIFKVFLPILLFQAALETNLGELRSNVRPIGALAVVGTFGAVVIIGLLLSATVFSDPALFSGAKPGVTPLLLGMLCGAILASTDTISVLIAFKSVRAPTRLAAIIEGESLFNDGAALVAFALVLALMEQRPEASGVMPVVILLLKTVLGGAAVGAIIGTLAGMVTGKIGDPLTSLMLTTVVAYGSFMAGDALQMSAVISTVVAGMCFRATAWTPELAPGSRLAMSSFWEFAGFLVNSFVFLLLGFQLDLGHMTDHILPILWGLGAIHIARVLTVYPMLASGNRLGEPIPMTWRHVLVAGNIKGAISASMALLVPATLVGGAAQDLVLSMTFGIVLLTLLLQGLTLPAFLRAMGLGLLGRREVELQTLQMGLVTGRAALRELDRLHELGLLAGINYRHLRSRYQLAVAQAEQGLQQMQTNQDLDEAAKRMISDQRHLLIVEKSAILDAVRDKIVSEEAAAPLLAKIDEELLSKGRYLEEG